MSRVVARLVRNFSSSKVPAMALVVMALLACHVSTASAQVLTPAAPMNVPRCGRQPSLTGAGEGCPAEAFCAKAAATVQSRVSFGPARLTCRSDTGIGTLPHSSKLRVQWQEWSPHRARRLPFADAFAPAG